MPHKTPYPINELFLANIIEGPFEGERAIWIRFQGCPVRCAWCDTKYSWVLNPENQETNKRALFAKKIPSAQWAYFSHSELVTLLERNRKTTTRLLITGGEPATYPSTPLMVSAEALGFSVMFESSGAVPIQELPSQCWLVISPKLRLRGSRNLMAETLFRADEIRFPIAREGDLSLLEQELQATLGSIPKEKIWLQPIAQNPRMRAFVKEMAAVRGYHAISRGVSISREPILTDS